MRSAKPNDFNEYLRQSGVTDTGGWARPGSQEQEAHISRATRDRPKVPKVDDELCEQFYMSVEVQVSDKRRRDLDGCLATICDCITAARRQLEDYSKHLRPRKGGSKRRRGRDDNA
jgi:hypothetical protein